jgi:phage terminase large subunit
MPYAQTTATKKVKALNKRIRVVCGGTSASKTISILLYLIAMAQSDKTPTLTSIVSESFPHLRRGAMRDFLNIMQEHGYFNENLWSKTDYTYTFETGSKIEFFSADMPSKVRGPRRDRLFMNEGNNIAYESWDQLLIRTKEFAFLDYNPTNEFWFYTEILGKRDDVDFITLTYKDNEALDKNIVSEIESHKLNAAWWKVYGLGQLGEVEGKIFTNWKIIDEIPHEARLVVRGLDFGYARDPDALCDIYYYNGGYIIDELVYRVGMKDRQLADVILNQPDPNVLTIGDSADKKAIDLLREYGVNIIGVDKKGSGGETFTNSAIKYVQGLQVSITKRSTNYIKSYRNFMWMTDKEGRILPKYDHFWSDGMMSVVYGLTSTRPREEEDDDITTGNITSMWG